MRHRPILRLILIALVLPLLLVTVTLTTRRTFAQIQGCATLPGRLIDLESGREHGLATYEDFLVISPDGQYRAYEQIEQSKGTYNLYIQDLKTRRSELVSEQAGFYEWSPDSEWLLFSYVSSFAYTSLAVFRLDSGEIYTVDFEGTIPDAQSVAWSPDSQQIVVAYTDWTENISRYELLSIPDFESTFLFESEASYSDIVAWSPSGEHVGISRGVDSVRIIHIADLRTVMLPFGGSSGNVVRIHWSPGADYFLVYYPNSDWTVALNIFDTEGNPIFSEFVTDATYGEMHPIIGWVDDHRLVASEWNEPLGRPDLVALDLAKGERQMLIEAVWSWELTDDARYLVTLPMNVPEGEFMVWSTSGYTPVHVAYYSKAYELTALDIAEDGASLLLYDDLTLRVMDAASGAFIYELPMRRDGRSRLDWFPCSQLAERVKSF
jgi:dipeptidyl aminopeptidase/acylaminoacyl peptidase